MTSAPWRTLGMGWAPALPVAPVPFVGFLVWLRRQAERPDVTGTFARNVRRIERIRRGHFTALVQLLCFCHAVQDFGGRCFGLGRK